MTANTSKTAKKSARKTTPARAAARKRKSVAAKAEAEAANTASAQVAETGTYKAAVESKSAKVADKASTDSSKQSPVESKAMANADKAQATTHNASSSGANRAQTSDTMKSGGDNKSAPSGSKRIRGDVEGPNIMSTLPAEAHSLFTDRNVTRLIALLALVIASGSLAYIAYLERNGGILTSSASNTFTRKGAPPAAQRLDKATILSSLQYLSTAVRGSQPFSTELAVTYKMVGDHPEIGKLLDEILPGAETGIPSIEDVSISYTDTISEIYGHGPGRLLGQAASNISSIVGIYTIERQRQTDIEKMTVLVAQGKLAAALRVLDKLDGEARLPFASWQIKAQRRVALDAAMSEIKRIAFLSILDGAL